MNSQEERRVEGIHRVPVEALVEVCGLKGEGPSFEAESRNVSDRGIRLRTAYLPEIGAPVVCRFESEGQEVLAEGVIAWCSPQPRGGEFGVRFTALNSKSAQVLGRLCRADTTKEEPSAGAGPLGDSAEPSLRAGTRVKLHIDGLSSPMRARVQQNDSDQISVNSSLEFLKLGKRLQLENVDAGDHSEAYIDGIDVIIDPKTGVPNLVVVLRSHEAENTPEPSVIDTRSEREHSQTVNGRSGTAPKITGDSDEEAVDGMADEVAKMRGKLEQSLSKVGLIVRITGTQAASLGRSLRDRGGPLMQRLTRNWSGARRNKPDASPPRRRTAPPPSQVSGATSHGLRPQSAVAASPEAAPRAKPKQPSKLLVGTIGASVLLVTVIAVASRGGAPSTASNSSNPQARSAANATSSALASIPLGPTASAVPGASALMAPVPLFGPTPMATLEPAPLGSAPVPTGAGSPNAVAEREMAAAKAATAKVAAGTEESSEEPSESASSSDEPATKPEDVAPWGKGKMHEPTIYKVRLDGPGTAIKGTSFSHGFSVIIPKRKAQESPKGYTKQDSRLELVSAANGESGVKILWRFKDEIPGYRVRLRKNTVEFLISSKAK